MGLLDALFGGEKKRKSSKKKKTNRKAVKDPITGKVLYYTNTKTVGLRDPITGKIVKRIPKEKAKKRGILMRTYTIFDELEDLSKPKRGKKRKKKDDIFGFDFF
jgi:hypothetical protein